MVSRQKRYEAARPWLVEAVADLNRRGMEATRRSAFHGMVELMVHHQNIYPNVPKDYLERAKADGTITFDEGYRHITLLVPAPAPRRPRHHNGLPDRLEGPYT